MTTDTAAHATIAPVPAMPWTWREINHCSWVTAGLFSAGLLLAGLFTSGFSVVIPMLLFIPAIVTVLVWVFTPLSWLLGRALRRIPSPAVHAVTFGVLGGLVCVGLGFIPGRQPDAYTAILAIGSGTALAVGWWSAYRARIRRARYAPLS